VICNNDIEINIGLENSRSNCKGDLNFDKNQLGLKEEDKGNRRIERQKERGRILEWFVFFRWKKYIKSD